MPATSYAAPFEPLPGRTCWVVLERQNGALSRVDAVSDWLLELFAGRHARNTLRANATSLSLWWRWCRDSSVDPHRATSTQFAQFVLALQTVPKEYPLTSVVRGFPGDPRLRSPRTIRNRVLQIKSFYEWAGRNGRVSSLTAAGITGFRTPPAPTVRSASRLTGAQLNTLTQAALHPRDRLVIELLLCAGLREGEALGIRLEDLCLSHELAQLFECNVPAGPHLHVRKRDNPNRADAKSTEERIIPIIPRLMGAIRDWQSWANDHMPESIDSLYLILSTRGTTRGRPWSVSGFATMWDNHIKSLPGLEKSYPHLLRHTFASQLIDAGVPAFTVQELLGHRSPDSTAIYTHAHMNALVDAVERLADWRERRGA